MTKAKCICVALLLILTNLSMIVAAEQEPLVIADKGKSKVSIVIANEATKKVRIAAEDIQITLKESTGVLLPIINEKDWQSGPRLLVGKSTLTESTGAKVSSGYDFGKEEILVRNKGNDIIIMGNDDGNFNGTQDAVIRFLNTVVGAYLYIPTADYKVVHKHDRLVVGKIDIMEKPAFDMRPYMHFSDLKLRAEYGRWNHAGEVKIDHRHSGFMIAPPKKYFKDHPEYYAEINGERRAEEGINWQLCTSNPEVIKLAVQFCRNYLDKDPNLVAAPLSFNDNKLYCTCAECSKMDKPDPFTGASRRICIYANAVAREIAKSHPGKGVAFYAYLNTSVPPEEDIKLESNVTVVYCLSEGCCIHGLINQNCAANRDELQRLKQWSKIAPKLKIYDYYNFLGDYRGLPFCNLQRLVDNIGIYKKLNIVGVYIDGPSVNGQGPYYWATGQLMWNPNESAESLRKRYCDALFGKAAGAMNDYYKHLEEACVTSGSHAPVRGWMMPGPLYIWKDHVIKQLNDDLSRAGAFVSEGSIEARRIDDQKLHMNYTQAFVELKLVQRTYWQNETQENLKAYSDKRSEFLDYHDQLRERGLVDITQTLSDYAPENPHVSWDAPPTISLIKLTEELGMEPLSITNKAWNSSKAYGLWDEDIFGAYPNTSAKFAYDDNNLYVRVTCKDFNMPKMKASAKVRDANVWDDDSVRLSIALPANGNNSFDDKSMNRFDFLVNTVGTKRDEKNDDVSWNSNWDVKLASADTINIRSWAVIVVIPWQSLELKQAPKQLKANVFRHVTTETVQPLQYLSSTFGSFKNVKRYAIVTLDDHKDALVPLSLGTLFRIDETEDKLVLASKNENEQVSVKDRCVIIVTAMQATESEEYAAQELSLYLSKITEAVVSVKKTSEIKEGDTSFIIAVGKNSFTEHLDLSNLDVEDYIIDITPDRLLIVGGRKPPLETGGIPPQTGKGIIYRDRGTLYGVYEFLEQLGVRWYRPEEWGEHVPKTKKIVLSYGSKTYRPKGFPVRTGLPELALNAKGKDVTQLQNWLVRNRVQLGFIGKFGGGVSAYARFGGGHVYFKIITAEKYFETHPEYFALIDGKRSDKRGVQPCFSNPEVQDIITEYMINWAKRLDGGGKISLEPNDSLDWCECEKCRAWDDPTCTSLSGTKVSMSNRIIHFSNIVLDRVEKEVPNVQATIYAYYQHAEAPTLVDVHPRLTVAVADFIGYNNYARFLDKEPSCRENTRYLVNLKNWRSKTKGDLDAYNYFNLISFPGPAPILNLMQERYQVYKKLDLSYIYCDAGSNVDWGPQELMIYMRNRLEWDPYLDLDEELKLYCHNYFGPAADTLYEYYTMLEKEALNGPPIYFNGTNLAELYSESLISRMAKLIEKAESQIKGQPLYEKRFIGLKAGCDYVRMHAKISKLLNQRQPQKALIAWNELESFCLEDRGIAVFGSNKNKELKKQIEIQLSDVVGEKIELDFNLVGGQKVYASKLSDLETGELNILKISGRPDLGTRNAWAIVTYPLPNDFIPETGRYRLKAKIKTTEWNGGGLVLQMRQKLKFQAYSAGIDVKKAYPEWTEFIQDISIYKTEEGDVAIYAIGMNLGKDSAVLLKDISIQKIASTP